MAVVVCSNDVGRNQKKGQTNQGVGGRKKKTLDSNNAVGESLNGAKLAIGDPSGSAILETAGDLVGSVGEVAGPVGMALGANVIRNQVKAYNKMGGVWTKCKKLQVGGTTLSAGAGVTMGIIALATGGLPGLAVAGLANHAIGYSLRQPKVQQMLETKICGPVSKEYSTCIAGKAAAQEITAENNAMNVRDKSKGGLSRETITRCWQEAVLIVMKEQDDDMEATLEGWVRYGVLGLHSVEDKMLEKLNLNKGPKERRTVCKIIKDVAFGNEYLGVKLFGSVLLKEDLEEGCEYSDEIVRRSNVAAAPPNAYPVR